MKRNKYAFLAFISAFLIISLNSAHAKISQIQNAQIIEDYGKIPLSFTTNKGQLDSQVKFAML